MITFLIYGLDQFVVGRLSRELSLGLADIYETSEDMFEFIAPEATVFHNGVEQTSWDIFVKINASQRYALIEEVVAKYLLSQLSYFAINVHLEFTYFDEDRVYEKINKEYPRFITEENIVNIDNGAHRIDDDDELDEDSEYNDEEIFDGDIFQDFNDKK